MTNSGFIFVAGVGRSGTTALARLLSSHSEISIGVERYKYLLNTQNIARITPALFEERTFFTFLPEQTNITPCTPRWLLYYANLQRKFASSRYYGDKVPGIFRYYGHFIRTFPDVQIVFITRDINSVAVSWEKRASDVNDAGWPAAQGTQRAIAIANKANQLTLRHIRRYPEVMKVVEYEKLFSGDFSYYERLLQELGITETGPGDRRYYENLTKDWDVRNEARRAEAAAMERYTATAFDSDLRDTLVREHAIDAGDRADAAVKAR